MEIIDKMNKNDFDSICDAGLELVGKLMQILKDNGLGHEHAASVIAVAAAGIAKGSSIKNIDIAEMADSIKHLWSVQNNGIVFDRGAEIERDITNEN